jgi:hypothetical protein
MEPNILLRRRIYSAILIMLLFLFGFLVWRNSQLIIDENKLGAIEEYKEAAVIMLTEVGEIEKIYKRRNENKYKYGVPPYTILSANKSNFENVIEREIDTDFQEVKELWDKQLLDGGFHSIRMTSDSMIAFKVKAYDNWTSWVEHWIYYGSGKQIDELCVNVGARKIKRIDTNWVYLSGRGYPILDMLRY